MFRLTKLLVDRRASITLEAAVAFPVVVIMLILTADTVRYLETLARMDRVAAVVADLTARNETVVDRVDFHAPEANNDLAMFMRAGHEVAHPDDLPGRGRIYISSVAPKAGGHTELWQRTGPYVLEADSRLDELPQLPTNGNFIVAEVIYDFSPMLMDAVGFGEIVPLVMYRRAIFRPRLNALESLEAPGD